MSQTSSLAHPTARRADVAAQPLACTWTDGGAGAAWVHVAGELDLATSGQLAQALREAQVRAHVVVLDLRDLTGVDVIVDAGIAARRTGGRLVVLRDPGNVEAVFTLTGRGGEVEFLDADAGEPPSSGPGPVDSANRNRGTTVPRRLDAESRAWWERLHATEPIRGWAIAELYERLRREAAFHIRHRVGGLSEFPRSDIDDLATQAAGDALVVLLRKLEDFRGDSQFWTWARKFAALEAPVSIRRRLGHDRVGISRHPEHACDVADPAGSAHDRAEFGELLHSVSEVIINQLTARQRTVLTAIAINGVSTATLADELDTTPGAIYKSLHDARAKIRLITAPDSLRGGRSLTEIGAGEAGSPARSALG